MAQKLVQFLVAPIFAHAAVQEVLIDARKLVRQHLVENIDNLLATLHRDGNGTALVTPWQRLLDDWPEEEKPSQDIWSNI